MAEKGVSEAVSQRAQWSTKCDGCDNAVEHFCKTCGDKFCSGCRDLHLSWKKNRHHEIVPYTGNIRPDTQSTCQDHPGERFQLYCKLCCVPVCIKCVTGNHEGHHCSDITNAYDVLKVKAIFLLESKTKKLRPQIQEMLSALNEKQKQITNTATEIEKEMKDTAQRLVNEVYDVLEENLKDLHRILEETMIAPLRERETEIKEILVKVDREIQLYNDNLRSRDPADLLNFMKDREGDDSLDISAHPINVDQRLPVFTPGQISRVNIQQQLGKVTIDGNKTGPSKSKIEEESRKECHVKTTPGAMADVNTMTLLTTPVFQSRFSYIVPPYGIRLLASDRAWIHGYSTSRIDLVGSGGNILCTVDAGCKLYDLCGKYVTEKGDMIYNDYNSKRVRAVSPSGQVRTLFSTADSKPLGLCRQQSGELVVGLDGVLRIYAEDGRIVREVGRGRVKNPWYITTNKVTGDILVCDYRQRVEVFTEDGEHRYSYLGHDHGRKFDPRDLCCDSQGHLLISDYDNNRVHILDNDGRFIRYLGTEEDGISYPLSIDVDDQGCAWVGEFDTKTVKIIRYLQ